MTFDLSPDDRALLLTLIPPEDPLSAALQAVSGLEAEEARLAASLDRHPRSKRTRDAVEAWCARVEAFPSLRHEAARMRALATFHKESSVPTLGYYGCTLHDGDDGQPRPGTVPRRGIRRDLDHLGRPEAPPEPRASEDGPGAIDGAIERALKETP